MAAGARRASARAREATKQGKASPPRATTPDKASPRQAESSPKQGKASPRKDEGEAAPRATTPGKKVPHLDLHSTATLAAGARRASDHARAGARAKRAAGAPRAAPAIGVSPRRRHNLCQTGSRRRRGSESDRPWQSDARGRERHWAGLSTPPRLRRGDSGETGRGDAAASPGLPRRRTYAEYPRGNRGGAATCPRTAEPAPPRGATG